MKKLKIRSKLLLSFGVVLILTVIISVFSILQLEKANSNLKDFMEGAVAADDAVKSCRIATFIAAKDVRDMVIQGKTDSAVKQEIDEQIEAIRTNLKKVQELDILNEEKVNELSNTLEGWIGVADDIIADLDVGDQASAGKKILTECEPELDKVIQEINGLIDETVSIRTKTLSDSVSTTNQSMIILLAIAVIAIIIAIPRMATIPRIFFITIVILL